MTPSPRLAYLSQPHAQEAPPETRPAGLIAELPLDERPRERLLRNGPKALTDAELVAILLRNGRPGASVLEVAREILVSAGGLPGLAGACARSLRRNGVGQVKLATLLAAVEIASRMALAAVPDRQPLSRPAAVAKFIDLRYGRTGQEVLGALYVNARHDLLEERELYRGTQHRASVEPREILRYGLLCGAVGVVMFHTHPSVAPRGAQGESPWGASFGAGEWLRRQARGPEEDPRLKPFEQRGQGTPYRPEGCQPE